MEGQTKLYLSERATAKHAGVSRATIRKYWRAGAFVPVKRVRTPYGLCKFFDAEAVKEFFDSNPDFKAHQARRRADWTKRKAADQ
jgi:hypothetical protein